ncbi:PREDICTED: interferon gamma receptor 1 [Gekko japonicus]|uniref:Interferon gamma receptor 1 n=1 Tax=Gekko japonicus TaxID=146911 RepID=A0ABM1L1F7_GEKJA|nr:PREDICTED: interferon gamma receptor 1 [Gekko japonicus]
MGLARPFAVLALLALTFCGRPATGTEEPQPKVPLPTNVEIKTYNFNTSLHWNYQSMLPEPLFTVQILCYGHNYTEVSSCVNVSQHYCDLTHKINKGCFSLWARVKVLVGSRESEYKESKVFRPFRDAQIGPPKFNLSVMDDGIIVDIEHPLTPYHGKDPLSVKENLTDFTYKVFLWKQASPQKYEMFEPEPEDCDMEVCTVYRQALLGFTYCVSVQGISEFYSLSGEVSNASCIILPSRHPLGTMGAIIAGVVVFVAAVVVLAILLVHIWTKRRNIPLPKSLVSIVRSIKPVNSFETKTDGKYATISSLSYKPVCEDGKPMEPIDHLTEVETSDLEDSGKIVIESQTIQEARGEESCESEQNREASDTYFKSVSGQEEMCNNLPNGDVHKADVQQPIDLEACRKVSGYDKPHWLHSESSVA